MSKIKFKPQVRRLLSEEQIQELKDIEGPWVQSHSAKGFYRRDLCRYGTKQR